MKRIGFISILLFGTLFLVTPINCNTDETTILTLEDAVNKALARDELVRQARISVRNALNSLIRVRTLTPRLSIGANASAASSAGLDPQSEITGTEYSSQGYGLGVDIPLSDGTHVNVSTSASTSTTNSSLAQGGGMEYTYADAYVGASISRALPFFRDDRVLIRGSEWSAELALQSAEFALEDARRNVVADTYIYFFNAVRAGQRAEIASMSLVEADELLRIAREKLKLGKIPEIDVMEAQVNAASAKTAARQSQSALESELDRLKNYLGIPLDEDVKLASQSQEIMTPDLQEEELVGCALQKRADLRRMGLVVKSAELDLRKVKAQSKPGTYLTGGYSRSGGASTISGSFDNLVNPSWSIGLSTSISLSHEENRTVIDEAESTLYLAQTEERLYKEEIRLEIRRLLREIEDAEANISLLAETVTQAEENLSIRKIQLEHGLGRPIDVMQTERQLAEARRQYADALIDIQLARMQLVLAVGETPMGARCQE